MRLADEELAVIELAAGRAGLTPTGYVGAVALAAADGTVPPVPSQSRQALGELMAARAQVRRFGGNVNQAVAALHSTGGAPEWLGQAVQLTARAVARVDAAAELLMRRRRDREGRAAWQPGRRADPLSVRDGAGAAGRPRAA